MKVTFRKELLVRLLKWSQGALFAGAVLLLGYCVYALGDAWIFQRRASRVAMQPESAAAARVAPAGRPDGLIGRIEIPRVRLSVAVLEGVDTTTLRRAVGHIPGTALPGESGNVGLAGHRDTFFRLLKNLKIQDEIRISTAQGRFTYQVVSLTVVDPENVGVLAASGENLLTLVTCYPFYFVGPAPKRWIVKARQVSPETVTSSSVK